MTEAAFTYVKRGATLSYASDDISEKYFPIRRYMLLRYINWTISDVDFENHLTAVLPPWATYHFKNHDGNDGLRLKYVFVDFKTTYAQPTTTTTTTNWKSILGPAKSEGILEVFAVRGAHYSETSDAYLEIIREFANRAAELAREGGNSIETGQKIEPYDDVQFVYSGCTSRGQWERYKAREGQGE
jgi:hypothetical protein